MGFGLPITTLTAAHFHFAGLAAGAATAQIGRLLPGRSRAYVVGAWSVALTPILVAIGITTSPTLEVVTAFALAAGVVLVAVSVATNLIKHRRPAVALRTLAQGVSVGTMALAALYALGEW